MTQEHLTSPCGLCPRQCRADRRSGAVGYCGCSEDIYVARAALHMWEEPCISGEAGSGTVFFSGCALRCIFCQNGSILRGNVGRRLTIDELCDTFLDLQKQGAANINLVTPTQYAPFIAEALIRAKGRGLAIPVVYNTGGYDLVDTIRMFDGLVDIYLPDLKYMDPALAKAYSRAEDYPEVAKAAIAEMARQVGTPEFDDSGYMKKGVIVRHLVLPGHTKDSRNVIKYLHETYGDNIYVSIMNQYTPMRQFTEGGELAEKYPELGRRITKREYDKVVDFAIETGMVNAFIQEGETAKESFIPEFMKMEETWTTK